MRIHLNNDYKYISSCENEVIPGYLLKRSGFSEKSRAAKSRCIGEIKNAFEEWLNVYDLLQERINPERIELMVMRKSWHFQKK